MRPVPPACTLLLAACLIVGGSPQAMSAPVGTAPGTARAATSAWRPPITPVDVERRFRPPKERWLAGHRGVDLRTQPGAVVRSAGAGRVTFAATLAGRGVVVVDHGRLRTTYEPVTALVPVGARVAAGAPIGTVALGSGHCGDGTCLHLGLRQGRIYLDPLLLIRPTAALLRPW